MEEGRVFDCVFFYQNCADRRATGKTFACEHSHIVCHMLRFGYKRRIFNTKAIQMIFDVQIV